MGTEDKRIASSWGLCFGFVCLLAIGCDRIEPQRGAGAFANTGSSANSGAAVPYTVVAEDPVNNVTSFLVVDRFQRRVKLPDVPQRIVSLAPSITELLFALKLEDRIVGATEHCNYPEAAKSIPRVGNGMVEGISRETIVQLKPDVVLCKSDTHEPLVGMLEQLGIRVLGLGPESLAELYAEARMLGKITGHSSEAEQVCQKMQSQLAAIAKRTESIESKYTVFFEVWDEPLMTVGPSSFLGEVLSLAKLKNIVEDTSRTFPTISPEIVLARNPDVLLTGSGRGAQWYIEKVHGRVGWNDLSAVRNHRVFVVNSDKLSRCGPRLLDALDEIVQKVYPESNEPSLDPAVAPGENRR